MPLYCSILARYVFYKLLSTTHAVPKNGSKHMQVHFRLLIEGGVFSCIQLL